MSEKGIKSERIISINGDRKRRNLLDLGVQEKARSVLTISGPVSFKPKPQEGIRVRNRFESYQVRDEFVVKLVT